MERVFSPDDRIRRAEEIYAKRQALRERTKRARVSVNEESKKMKVFKKTGLQVTICLLLYFTFHLINTTNYSFSESTISKIKEIVSVDYDFYSIYNSAMTEIKNYLYPDENLEENNQEEGEENKEEGEAEKKEVEGGENIGILEEEESLTQSEIIKTEESETERIKRTYSFKLPVHGKVSSEYGEREVTSEVVTAYHKGIDIRCKYRNTNSCINRWRCGNC